MRRPLPYFVIFLILGGIIYLGMCYIFLLGLLLMAFLILASYIFFNRRYFFILSIFLILGTLNMAIYFNYNFKTFNNVKIRVLQKTQSYAIGSVGLTGRKVRIFGKLNEVEEGMLLNSTIKFQKSPEYSKGIIGTVTIKEYRVKKDYIYNIYKYKDKIYKDMCAEIGNEKSAEVMSLSFGDTKYLSKEQWQEFKTLGVVHAVSVSGFHIALIFSILKRVTNYKIAAIISGLYCIFCGGQAATFRALIMIVTLNLSYKFYKNYDGISSLCFAGIILLMCKPYYFLDVGFVLSFLSTLGIVLYYNKLRKRLYKLPTKINDTISITLSAQVFSVPYASLIFNNFSPGFFAGNFLLLPLFSWIILMGNAMLLVFPIKILYNIFLKITNLILLCCDGITYISLIIVPPTEYISFLEGLCMLLLVFALIMVKHGLSQGKLLPIVVVIMLIFQYYSIFPAITYYKFSKGYGVVFNYGKETVLFSDDEEDKEILNLKDSLRFDRVNNDLKKDYTIIIPNRYKISIGRYEDKGLHCFHTNIKNLKYGNGNYDIIVNKDFCKYIVVLGKVIRIY